VILFGELRKRFGTQRGSTEGRTLEAILFGEL
jgi:hypothetical protein